jgi:hypothetical protein
VIQPPVITTTQLPNGTVDAPYTAKIEATSEVAIIGYRLTLGALPAGLTLNDTTGEISGTPTAEGLSNFVIGVRSGAGETSQVFGIIIAPAPIYCDDCGELEADCTCETPVYCNDCEELEDDCICEDDPGTSINDLITDNRTLQTWTQDGTLYIKGLTIGQMYRIYSINGTMVYQSIATADIVGAKNFSPLQNGIYIIHTENQSVKIVL